MKRLLLLSFLIFIITVTTAQKKSIIGINLTTELASSEEFTFGIGTSFERQISKHSGIETGVLFRNFPNRIYYLAPSGYAEKVIIAERYLTLPILYKFYSKTINFSIGPSVDFYLGWKQRGNYDNFYISAFEIRRKTQLGFLIKVSKDFKLTKKVSFEPELRANSISSMNRAYVGIGLTIKYNNKR